MTGCLGNVWGILFLWLFGCRFFVKAAEPAGHRFSESRSVSSQLGVQLNFGVGQKLPRSYHHSQSL